MDKSASPQTEHRTAQRKTVKISRARWLWIAAAVALGVFFIWMSWPRAQTVDVAVIDRGAVVREITDEGRTRIHEVFVVAAPVGGELQRIDLEPGDPVARNEVIATIAPADPALLDARVGAEARAGVGAARSALAAAEADADLARRTQERTARLAAGNVASSAALDAANAGLRAARARAAAARAELQRAQAVAGASVTRARGRMQVRSPSSGRVLRLLQESETVVPAGAPLIEIGDPRDMEIVAQFLSQDAIALRAGARAWIDNWGGDKPIAARISRIEPFAFTKVSALGVEEQRVNVIVRLEDPAGATPLGHQFRVDVRAIVSEAPDVVRVPTDALVRDGEGWGVFRLERGRARLAPVVLGEGGDQYRVVLNGLGVGDRVVIFPGDSLEDGARVRPSR